MSPAAWVAWTSVASRVPRTVAETTRSEGALPGWPRAFARPRRLARSVEPTQARALPPAGISLGLRDDWNRIRMEPLSAELVMLTFEAMTTRRLYRLPKSVGDEERA